MTLLLALLTVAVGALCVAHLILRADHARLKRDHAKLLTLEQHERRQRQAAEAALADALRHPAPSAPPFPPGLFFLLPPFFPPPPRPRPPRTYSLDDLEREVTRRDPPPGP